MKRIVQAQALVAISAMLAACAHKPETAVNGDTTEPQQVKVAALLKRAAEESRTQVIPAENGVLYSRTFDGKRFASIIRSKVPGSVMSDGAKEEIGTQIADLICQDELSIEAMQAGYSAGADVIADDDQVILSVTLTADDCLEE